MKNYIVLKPVSDSKDNHKYYGTDSTIKLDKARADVLLASGTIRELDEETANPAEESKESKEKSVTKEAKETGKTKAQTEQ
ncbi:hypothetical protein [Dyadobacter sp. OTU695]|uniref:hypothetical protein n=1 Tax=Dyadobacter sp. OTU695 TaxID=3043860 RepID=UPI00313EA919